MALWEADHVTTAMTNLDLAKIQYRKVHALLARKRAGEDVAAKLRSEQRTMREVLARLPKNQRSAFNRWQIADANRAGLPKPPSEVPAAGC